MKIFYVSCENDARKYLRYMRELRRSQLQRVLKNPTILHSKVSKHAFMQKLEKIFFI
jgi:hypothetical protein